MNLSSGLIFFIAAGLIASGVLSWSVHRKISFTTEGRRELTTEEFAALFPGAEEIAMEVRREIEKIFAGNIAKVHPNDLLVRDLMIGAIDGLEANELIQNIERSCSISIPQAMANDVLTVNDLVHLVKACKYQ